MMELCHSWDKRPIRLSATRRYTAEEMREKCKRVTPPFWLRVEDKLIQVHPSRMPVSIEQSLKLVVCLIQVHGEACLMLACEVSAAYHDWLAYNAQEDDGFCKDMEAREERVRQRMEEPPSENSDYDGEDEW